MNRNHYRNVAREPHEGGVAQYIRVDGTKSNPAPVRNADLDCPSAFELVQTWWDVDAQPGAKWKDIHGCVFTKGDNGYWSVAGPGTLTAVQLEDYFGPGELVAPEPDQPATLTDRQNEVLTSVAALLHRSSMHLYLDGEPAHVALCNAFPEVFSEPDPTGGDLVVMARIRDDNPLELFFRCMDGSWSLHHGRESGPWTTNMLQGIRRLQPATIAELTSNATKEEA